MEERRRIGRLNDGRDIERAIAKAVLQGAFRAESSVAGTEFVHIICRVPEVLDARIEVTVRLLAGAEGNNGAAVAVAAVTLSRAKEKLFAGGDLRIEEGDRVQVILFLPAQ